MFKQEELSTSLILAIHPRIPFTRIGVYLNKEVIFLKKIIHDKDELGKYNSFAGQTEFRTKEIIKELNENDIITKNIKIIISGGGIVKPVDAGIYEMNESIKNDLSEGSYGDDVLNLGGLIAYNITKVLNSSRAFIVDPVSVDEFTDLARVSGHSDFKRKSVFHALKHISVVKEHAKTVMQEYNKLKLIVCYLGNGITIAAHNQGRVIDSTQGLDGDGPFSVTRSGSLPAGDLVRHCYSGKNTLEESLRMISREGGLLSYPGINNGYEIDLLIQQDDENAKFYFKAMAYQVLKSIGSMYAVLKADVDAILLTGGLTNSKYFLNEIIEGLEKFPPVHIYSTDDIMEILAKNAFSLLRNEVEISKY